MKRLKTKLEAALAAVAFAEEGEVDTARQMVAEAEAAAGEDRRGEAAPRSELPPRGPLAKGSRA